MSGTLCFASLYHAADLTLGDGASATLKALLASIPTAGLVGFDLSYLQSQTLDAGAEEASERNLDRVRISKPGSAGARVARIVIAASQAVICTTLLAQKMHQDDTTTVIKERYRIEMQDVRISAEAAESERQAHLDAAAQRADASVAAEQQRLRLITSGAGVNAFAADIDSLRARLQEANGEITRQEANVESARQRMNIERRGVDAAGVSRAQGEGPRYNLAKDDLEDAKAVIAAKRKEASELAEKMQELQQASIDADLARAEQNRTDVAATRSSIKDLMASAAKARDDAAKSAANKSAAIAERMKQDSRWRPMNEGLAAQFGALGIVLLSSPLTMLIAACFAIFLTGLDLGPIIAGHARQRNSAAPLWRGLEVAAAKNEAEEAYADSVSHLLRRRVERATLLAEAEMAAARAAAARKVYRDFMDDDVPPGTPRN